jgi:hypothetical protein
MQMQKEVKNPLEVHNEDNLEVIDQNFEDGLIPSKKHHLSLFD